MAFQHKQAVAVVVAEVAEVADGVGQVLAVKYNHTAVQQTGCRQAAFAAGQLDTDHILGLVAHSLGTAAGVSQQLVSDHRVMPEARDEVVQSPGNKRLAAAAG